MDLLRIRNLTLPTPAATTIMSSSTATTAALAAAMSSATASTPATPATAIATTTTTTPNTFFTYSIPGMDIAPGPFIFTYVSEFLSLITPEELPLDSIRDVLHKNVSLVDFASNAIKIESGFIALMSIFAILALVPLIATCAWCCGRRSTQDEVNAISNAPVNIRDESLENNLRCRKSAALLTLWIVFILLTLSDVSIFYANSRLSTGIEMTPEMVKAAVHDVEVFLKDTHLQIKHKLDNGFHVSVEKVVKDLEDVDVLLGEPIQAEISAHTGLELAYDSLTTLSLANAELIYRVLMLQETVGRALKLSQEAAARMEELQIQLSVLQRQCTYRDRPLCDTLRIRSFEENGVVDALKTLQEDQSIFRMRYLGEIEFGATVKNLTSEVGVSRSIFSNFPQQVKHDTAYERNYTLEQLASIRHRTTANAQLLTSTVNALLERLQSTWPTLEPSYNEMKRWANSYWSVGWIAGLLIVWVIIFLLMSYCCFICESNTKSGMVFFIAVLFICLGSIGLSIYAVISLAIGGNSQVFLCRSLYGHNYELLGKLLDKPGYVYAREPQTGIIGELLRPADVRRSVVNVQLGRALSVGAPTPEKDLATFIDQMQRVALQIQDVATSSRMTTLGSRSKRLQASILQPLENLQNEILYHLTALELQREPWAKQVNQTLNHLKNIQGYLENKAGEICHNLTRVYTERLKTYLTSSRATMESQLGDTTTKCRPFYDTFDASRTFLCRNLVDFVNGLWFFVFLTLLLWAIGTPVGLNLITIQTRLHAMETAHKRKGKGKPRRQRSDGSDRSVEQQRSRGRSQQQQRGRSKQRASNASKREQQRERSTSSTGRVKPVLRRTATEETLDIADDDSTPTRQSPPQQQQQHSTQRPSEQRELERGRERERDQRSRERELSRGREMSNLNTPVPRRPQLTRSGTDEYDLDESDIYGAQQDADAVANARRTPPRGAPPPPPPPAAGMNRSVRWHEAEVDFDFVDVDAPVERKL
ncbi:uncharacterized protein LOC108597069 isoform X3 [Drosophila busckii]|uniref:uncharacterized protein LOC108597069 isoform X3 n=1 Tax=Drosophila busckii TaxID=30019 RepID=UPI00083EEC39|nr:uncharacterized protein LOC108597069 isoform X3 [Drosophila busckii]